MKEFWGVRILLVMLSFALPHYAFAKDNKDLLQSLSKKDGGANTLYIENKGQIGDQNGKPNTSVKFLILRPGLNIQLKANSFSYDAYTIERFKRVERLVEPLPSKFDKQNDDSLVYHFSRVDIELVNANPNPEITQEGSSIDYLNYYTHITSQTHGEEGVTGVRGYSAIIYHDIYPNIDLEWFLDKNGKPEYQFIINPGGDPSRIRLKYHGAKKTELISDAIHIHIKPGIINEHIPLSYLKESKEKLHIAFTKVADNEYCFKIPAFASNETLVIDPMPNRLWGTYYGGNSADTYPDVATDASGNVYLGGSTSSSTDIASAGAYDVTFGGEYDAFLVKFSSNGSRILGTYFGGNDKDYCYAIATDGYSNVYLTGETYSTTEFASTGAFDETMNGSSDGFLVKFSSTGSRIWSTYFGGDSQDWCSSIATDTSGNVYLTGTTDSPTDIASTGAYDVTLGVGCDAFLAKFSSSGSRIWASYYGGLAMDEGFDIKTDASEFIYLTGYTGSTTDIASSWAYDTKFGGNFDAFLAKFSSTGIRIWGTYYGGSGVETGNKLAIDSSGFVYICGNTSSTTDIASTGAYDATLSGEYDAFLVKFTSNGSRIWGTYFGGNDKDYFNAIATDGYSNLYVGGSTSSTTDIASAGAYDVTFGGVSDAILVKFSSSGSRIWGTYYGGSAEDYAGTILTDASGNVYVGGYTGSTTDIATISAYDATLDGSEDAFLVKFDGNLYQVNSPILSNTNFCQNQSFSVSYTITKTFTSPNSFTAQLSDTNGSFINPTSIGTLSSTTSGSINCRIPSAISAGTGYRIRIISSNPSIIGSDNGTNIVINALPQPIISGSKTACEGSLTYTYSIPSILGHSYQWTSPRNGDIVGSNTSNIISVRWRTIGIDSLIIRQTNPQTGCFKDTNIIVTIMKNIIPTVSYFGNDNFFCTGDSRGLVCDIKADSYQWKRNGDIINGATAREFIAFKNGSYSVITKIGNCESESEVKDIIEYEKPKPIIEGDRETLLSSMSQKYSVGNTNIKRHVWSTSDNAIIIDSNSSNIVNVKFLKTGPSIIYILQESLQGCLGMDSIIVMVKSPSSISTNNQPSSVPYSFFPNPTGDAHQIILQFSEVQKQHIDIELLDILGNQLYQSSLNIGDQSTTIPIHNLCSGMYMLRIHMNNEVYMEKVIVN